MRSNARPALRQSAALATGPRQEQTRPAWNAPYLRPETSQRSAAALRPGPTAVPVKASSDSLRAIVGVRVIDFPPSRTVQPGVAGAERRETIPKGAVRQSSPPCSSSPCCYRPRRLIRCWKNGKPAPFQLQLGSCGTGQGGTRPHMVGSGNVRRMKSHGLRRGANPFLRSKPLRRWL